MIVESAGLGPIEATNPCGEQLFPMKSVPHVPTADSAGVHKKSKVFLSMRVYSIDWIHAFQLGDLFWQSPISNQP